jgi:hypothetical protein
MFSERQVELARSIEEIVLFLLYEQFMELSSEPPLRYRKKGLWVDIGAYVVEIYEKPRTPFNTSVVSSFDSEAVINEIKQRTNA